MAANVTMASLWNDSQIQEDVVCHDIVFKLWLNLCYVGPVCILGVLGNLVSFLVFSKDGATQPAAALQLKALAVADVCFLLAWFSQQLPNLLLEYKGIVMGSKEYWVWKIVLHNALFVSQTVAIWLTVLIAVNRFIIVCMPLKAYRLCSAGKVRIQIALVVICSILYNLPRCFDFKIQRMLDNLSSKNDTNETTKEPEVKYGASLTGWAKGETYQRVYINVMYEVWMFCVPLVLLVCLNTAIVIVYRAALKRRLKMQNMSGSERKKSAKEDSLTRLMVAVIFVFIVCFTPERVSFLIWKYKPQSHCSARYYAQHFFDCLEITNSAVNFVIYFLLQTRFRRIVKEWCCCRICSCLKTENTSVVLIEKKPSSVAETG